MAPRPTRRLGNCCAPRVSRRSCCARRGAADASATSISSPAYSAHASARCSNRSLAGDLAFLSALVFARTSEQDYKAYLYLREVAREGHSGGFPPLWFYDLLHSPSAHAFEYGLARTHALLAQLESVTGHAIRPDDLEAAVAESNAARAAVRRLLSLRQNTPRVTGTEALPLVGAFFLMDRPTYAALADARGR